MKNNKIFLEKTNQLIADGTPFVLSGVGSGLTAMAAVRGGADMLATYHTAAYRIQGVPSLLSCLPYDNCNDIALQLLPQIRAVCKTIPILVGLGAHDPRQSHEDLLSRVIDNGGDGVVNEPFIGAYDGILRKRLENAGLGFSCEKKLIGNASRRGLLTLAWCFSPDDAVQMVDQGAHFIGALVTADPSSPPSVSDIIRYVQSIVDAVEHTGARIPVLIHGTPVNDLAVVAEVLNNTGAAGYATGSSGERLPTLAGVSQAIADFKSIRKGGST